MDIRLLAYRRNTTSEGTYDLTQFELDLQKAPNVVANYNWINLKEPDKRKSSFSQTLKLPFSNRNNKFFENYFDVNLDTLVYNAKIKFNAILYVDSIPQLKGFIQLKAVYLNARVYQVVLFGATADFFTDIKSAKLKDAFKTTSTTDPDVQLIDGQLSHFLTPANIVKSWTSGVTLAGGGSDNDILYPIIDYGHTSSPYSSSMFWTPDDLYPTGIGAPTNSADFYGTVRAGDLKPAIRIQRLVHIIAQKAGYQIKSAFMGIDDTAGTPITDTQFFSRLFMTLANQFQRVQTLFNSVEGSQVPFIGFSASLSEFVYPTMPCVMEANDPPFPDNLPYTNYNELCYPTLATFTTAYDPNNLFSVDSTPPPAEFGALAYRPKITFPADFDGDDVTLSEGNFPVKVTATVVIPTSTIQGTDLGVCTVAMAWSEGGMVMNFDDELYGLSPGTHTIEWTYNMNCTPNNSYEFFMSFEAYNIYNYDVPTNNTWEPKVTALSIESINGGVNTLMGGGENGLVSIHHNLPDMTQSDFIRDLVNRFNLVIQTDADNEKLLLIEPYQDFIDAGSIQYWTDKLDISKEVVIKSTNELQSKTLKFSDLLDKDILNERYNKLYDVVYGQYEKLQLSDFAKKDFKNFSVFSPFIAQGIPYWTNGGINGAIPSADVALAYLFKAEVGQQATATDLKPKMFYYSGTPINVQGSNPNTSNNYSFHIYSNGYLTNNDAHPSDDNNGSANKFPLCLQYNLDNLSTGVTSTTKVLNWTYYGNNFNTGFTFNFFGDVYTDHGFYHDYWAQYINEIYSDEARIMECYLNLTPEDIRTFSGNGFQNTYFIKNTLWRIISISNYAVGKNQSTKVVLLKVLQKLSNDCGNIPSISQTGQITWVDAGTGASVASVTNVCCEEQNENWTFVQTNATTGVGDCYAIGGDSGDTSLVDLVSQEGEIIIGTDETFTGDSNGDTSGMNMAMMPTIQNNFGIQTSKGQGKSLTYFCECTTYDNSTAVKISFKGYDSNILVFPFFTMNYITVKLYGTVMSGDNTRDVGYFEYDTIITKRGDTNDYVGSSGGTFLKQNKDTSFSAPTVNITNFDGHNWSPTITGGADENIFWVAEVKITSTPINIPTLSTRAAIYQNADDILTQDLNYLLWN
tara:strand:- start:2693 stop:6100 length:3408 start_codon:yes stop_codon:yes gene_type:complete